MTKDEALALALEALEEIMQSHTASTNMEQADAMMKGNAAITAIKQAQAEKSGFIAALDIRTNQGWRINGGPIPVLYTDEINGQQVCRDDVWLAQTADLAKCKICGGTGEMDSGGTHPWGAQISIPCYCQDPNEALNHAYAEGRQDQLDVEPAPKQAEPVGINGLTEAETNATMSVMGLSKRNQG